MKGGRFSTSTDESGYYTLDVAAGQYAVNAQLPGYAFVPGQVQVVGGAVSAARPLVGSPLSGLSKSAAVLPPIFS